MTFSLHESFKNGGGAIVETFHAASEGTAIKKAEQYMAEHNTGSSNVKSVTLNRHLRGQAYLAVKRWVFFD